MNRRCREIGGLCDPRDRRVEVGVRLWANDFSVERLGSVLAQRPPKNDDAGDERRHTAEDEPEFEGYSEAEQAAEPLEPPHQQGGDAGGERDSERRQREQGQRHSPAEVSVERPIHISIS